MKECKRKFNKNKFSFKLRQRNLLKKQNKIVENFADMLHSMTSCLNLFFMLKQKLSFC